MCVLKLFLEFQCVLCEVIHVLSMSLTMVSGFLICFYVLCSEGKGAADVTMAVTPGYYNCRGKGVKW